MIIKQDRHKISDHFVFVTYLEYDAKNYTVGAIQIASDGEPIDGTGYRLPFKYVIRRSKKQDQEAIQYYDKVKSALISQCKGVYQK